MNQSKTSEELFHLIALSGQGDRMAFQSLYDATSAKLFGLSLRILNRRDLAEALAPLEQRKKKVETAINLIDQKILQIERCIVENKFT